MHRPRSATAAGTRLFVTYAVASLVPVAALGVVLANGNRQDAVERGLQYGRAQAAVVQEMAIAPALHGEDLALGLTAQERARLQTATDLAIFRGSIERLRLRDFGGAVVFSDDGSLSPGRSGAGDGSEGAIVPADDPAFRAAALGDTDVAILGTSSKRTIRVLQPIVGDSSGRSVGVLEIFVPYDAVAAEVEAATVRNYWRLGWGLGLLYLVLAGISWSTTRRLRRQAAQAAHDALHDPLTGLPNRELFRRRVEQATRRTASCAVVLMDLDRFKEVNDTLGHHAGDELLRVVAQRLAGMLRTGDTVARLGGDEFGMLLPGIGDPESARALVERASEELSAELVLDGVPLTIEACFGIALHPADGDDDETLLKSADAAMYQGKRGTAGVVVFDPALATSPSHHLNIQHDMRRALESGELRLLYQPKVDLGTGRTRGVEALLRWEHPERGLLLPGEFLPAVEQSGVMGPLTEWVVRQALADCAAWTAAGRDWTVAVNASARNLDQPEFADTVARLAAAAGVPPSRLQIEVTETALPVDLGAASRTLATLAAHGFGTALDDFGVGYASLSHLRSLELTEVKIDRTFVAGVGVNQEDGEVVRSLIQLAHGLGLTVCAEGVETAAAADWLRNAGCDRAQGFFFSRPRPWPTLPSGGVQFPSERYHPTLTLEMTT
jgi:diguanylate cyclase (GGDEF)-like protein